MRQRGRHSKNRTCVWDTFNVSTEILYDLNHQLQSSNICGERLLEASLKNYRWNSSLYAYVDPGELQEE